MTKIWVKARSVGDDEIIMYTCRWWLPRWFPGSAKRYGNLSSVVNAIKAKLNKQCEEIEEDLLKLNQAEAHLKSELKDIQSYRYDNEGETEWYQEDMKYLKTFQNYVAKPPSYYKEVLSPAFLRKLGIGNTSGKAKKSSLGDIPDNLAGSGARSIYVLGGTNQAAKNELHADGGADHTLDFHKPRGKERSKKSGSGKEEGHWKNRRKGESQEDYDERINIGEENWED